MLSTYLSRKKLIIDERGYIDDSNVLNQSFMVKNQSKNGGAISLHDLSSIDRSNKEKMQGKKITPKKGVKHSKTKLAGSQHKVPEKVVIEKVKKEPLSVKTSSEVDRVLTPGVLPVVEEFDLDKRKKQLENQIKEKDLELKTIAVQKQNGLVIPVDLVEGVFARNNSNFVVKFKQCIDNFSDEFSHKYGVSREDVGKFRGVAIDVINSAIKESIELSMSEMEGIINEYKTLKK